MSKQYSRRTGYVSVTEDGKNYSVRSGYISTATTAGGGFTMLASTGTFTASGQSAAFKISQASALAAYSAVGQDANFSINLNAGFGAFSLTGSDATLTQSGGVTMVADAGLFSLSGFDVGFNQSITAGHGSYALTGNSAAFNTKINAAHGSFTLAGIDATLVAQQSYTMAADTGIFSLTGFDANIYETTPAPQTVGGDYLPSPHKGWNKKEWERKKKKLDVDLEETLKNAWAELTTKETSKEIKKEFRELTAGLSIKKKSFPDFKEMDFSKVDALLKIWQKQVEENEEDEMLLLM